MPGLGGSGGAAGRRADLLPLRPFQGRATGFPGGSVAEESACRAADTGDMGLTPGLGRSPGGGHGNPLQHPCLENPWTEEPGGLQSVGSHRVTCN